MVQKVSITYHFHEKLILALEQCRVLRTSVTDRCWQALFEVIPSTGLPYQELVGLIWIDLDWEKGSLSVSKIYQRIDNKVYAACPNTRAGQRTVALGDMTLAALRQYRSEQDAWSRRPDWTEADRVFSRQDGGHLSNGGANQALRRWCEKFGLPHMSLHGLRHTTRAC